MAWLQTQLSFNVGAFEQTLRLIDELNGTLNGMETGLKTEIASTSALSKAATYFELDRDAEGLAILAQLRKDYPDSEAAVRSYLTEAKHYEDQNKTVDAGKRLTDLAEKFPQSEYAQYALLLAARYAASREQAESYREAIRRIEDLIELAKKYPPKNPANDLVFSARLMQGDLLRNLNDFPGAQSAYQELLNNYSQHQDIVLAQLRLAQTHSAQFAADPSHALKAEGMFYHLVVGLHVPLDVRVEAGCNLGELFARRGNADKAAEVWWSDVVYPFLIKERRGAELGEGRYWMSRTLLKVAELFEKQGKLEQAKTAWSLIIETKLDAEVMARQKLAP